MNFYDALEVIVKKLYRRLGFEILDKKGKIKLPTLDGEYVVFPTSDGFGFAPIENPEHIHWTIHTKQKIPKEIAWFYYLLTFFEEPAEFHEKVKGKVTKKFKWRDGYIPFGKFVKKRRKEYKKQLSD